jgi:hypothetical protein
LLLLLVSLRPVARVEAQAGWMAPEPLATLGNACQGFVDLQRQFPTGHDSWRTSLRVSIYPVGDQVPFEASTVNSDAAGQFVFYVSNPGWWDIGVKAAHALENRRRIEIGVGVNRNLQFGTLREGDADNNNAINAADFQLLKSAFWTADPRTDFNVSGLTDIRDFTLMRGNYGLSGPRVLRRPLSGPSRANVPSGGGLRLVVGSAETEPGGLVSVPVYLETGGAPVEGVELHLRYDPAALQLLNGAGSPADRLAVGSVLSLELWNRVLTAQGQAALAVGAPFGALPTDARIDLATLKLLALGPLGLYPIALEGVTVSYAGGAYSVALESGELRVAAPAVTATATPLPPTPTATPTPEPTPFGGEPGPYAVNLPLSTKQSKALGVGASPCSRIGVNVLGSITQCDVSAFNLGWYQNWGVQVNPPRPGGIEFAQLIRLRHDPANPSQSYWPPDWERVAQAARANPGSLWFVGNEPDVVTQDNCTPAEYAERYHLSYHAIKAADPMAQVSAAGIVYPTALRLRWLDQALAAYQSRYGVPMPVDAWNIHMQILPERRGGWGCEIPPGLSEDVGEDRQVADNASVAIFAEKVRLFRTWMRDRGQQSKALIISEYGVLMPSGHGYLGLFDKDEGDRIVQAFMTGTFDYCLTAIDPALGMPADGGRLVQRWAWYSLNDRLADIEAGYLGFNGGLFFAGRPYPGAMTVFGQRCLTYMQGLACP